MAKCFTAVPDIVQITLPGLHKLGVAAYCLGHVIHCLQLSCMEGNFIAIAIWNYIKVIW